VSRCELKAFSVETRISCRQTGHENVDVRRISVDAFDDPPDKKFSMVDCKREQNHENLIRNRTQAMYFEVKHNIFVF